MAVRSETKDDKLILTLDNGDKTKMEEAIERWEFKDIQSFLRFSISLLLEAEDKELWMKSNGDRVRVAPAEHSIRSRND